MVKTSGSLKLRDEICVEAGAISMESVNNGAPVNSQNHRINGSYTPMNYDNYGFEPRLMIDKAAGQTTRMSEYYGATKWKSARIVAGYADNENTSNSSGGTYSDFTPKGNNAYAMNANPAGFNFGAYADDVPGFRKAWGTADKGFSATRGEWVDLTRLFGFVYNNYPSSGTPYVALHHNTNGQLLTAVLNAQAKEYGTYSGALFIEKLTRKDGAKAESSGIYSMVGQSAPDGENYAETTIADGTRVHRVYWNSKNFGPDTNNEYGLQAGDTFILYFQGIR